jgi:phosphoesterase RecJ-like protein
MNEIDQKIKQRIKNAHNILIVSHVRPDGDAIGSLLGLGLALQNYGKNVQMVLSDGVPANFRYLPGYKLVMKSPKDPVDLAFVVDCSDKRRTGTALEDYGDADIVIDHHQTNELFGEINLVEPQVPATASVLMRHMTTWGLTITTDVASALLTGMITDTLGFRTINTTSEVLRQAADLMDIGAKLDKLYYYSMVKRTLPAARFWGAGLSNLHYEDGVVWAVLTREDRKKAGYSGNDDADLINVVSAIEEGKISIIFVEQPKGAVKISWRTIHPDIDVSALAVKFNGGGHKAASGADIQGSLDEVIKLVLNATHELLNIR